LIDLGEIYFLLLEMFRYGEAFKDSGTFGVKLPLLYKECGFEFDLCDSYFFVELTFLITNSFSAFGGN
jgi:hypothetical protein